MLIFYLYKQACGRGQMFIMQPLTSSCLTLQGEVLAAKFFKEVVTLGYIPDLPGHLSVMTDTDPLSQPSGTPHAMLSNQAPRIPAQTTHSPHSASQHRHTSASLAGSHRQTGCTSRLHSQGLQDSPRASWHPSHGATIPQRGAGRGPRGSNVLANPLLPNPSSCLRAAMDSHQPGPSRASQSSQSHAAISHQPGASVSHVGMPARTAAAAHNPLLPNPSACFRTAQDALQPSRLPSDAAEAGASLPVSARQPLATLSIRKDDPLVLSVMEITECSFAKAKKVCILPVAMNKPDVLYMHPFLYSVQCLWIQAA